MGWRVGAALLPLASVAPPTTACVECQLPQDPLHTGRALHACPICEEAAVSEQRHDVLIACLEQALEVTRPLAAVTTHTAWATVRRLRRVAHVENCLPHLLLLRPHAELLRLASLGSLLCTPCLAALCLRERPRWGACASIPPPMAANGALRPCHGCHPVVVELGAKGRTCCGNGKCSWPGLWRERNTCKDLRLCMATSSSPAQDK